MFICHLYAGKETDVLPPEPKRSKGRPKTKRLRSAVEIAIEMNKRKCSICGSDTHATKSCPCMEVGAADPMDSNTPDMVLFYF